MSRHRFYAPAGKWNGNEVVLSAEESHHLEVLRVGAGDEVFVFDGIGVECKCRVLRADARNATLQIIESMTGQVESPLQVVLCQALAKGDKFDFIVQKAAELGVAAVVPLATDRADVKLVGERAEKRRDRWRRISLEAIKQCGRRRLMTIADPITVDSLLGVTDQAPGTRPSVPVPPPENGGPSEARTHSETANLTKLPARSREHRWPVVACTETGGMAVQQAVQAMGIVDRIFLLVGPEGGWSERELELVETAGVTSVSLGPRILRTETAAIVAAALLQHTCGDLSR